MLVAPLETTPVAAQEAANELTVRMRGEPLRLTFAPWFAGAVSQLEFRGTSYINSADHGRLIQSALSLDGWGECLNPTEAGSVTDGRQRRTTSVLMMARAKGRVWHSRTQMAYWMPPRASHQVNPSDLRVHAAPQPCTNEPARRHITSARNSTPLSDIVLDKRIKVSGRARDLLQFSIAFELKRDHQQVMFEALTAYLEPQFSRFYEVEPSSGKLIVIKPVKAGERPMIVATSDGRHAMGMAALKGSKMYLGAFRWPETSKLNCFVPRAPVASGSHRFDCLISVGTLEEVRATMAAQARPAPASHN